MAANRGTLLARAATAFRREPLWRLPAPPWLGKILAAGGAHLEGPDVMVSRPGAGQSPVPAGGPAPPGEDGTAPQPPAKRSHPTEFDSFFGAQFADIVKTVRFAGAKQDEAESAAMNAMVELFWSWPLLEDKAGWVRVTALHDYLNTPKTAATASPSAIEPLRVAVERLSPAQREVVALSMDGYRPTDIAKLLGRPTNNVSSTLRHAYDRLHENLAATT